MKPISRFRLPVICSTLILVTGYFVFEIKGAGRAIRPTPVRVQSASCLRQIGLAIMMYSNDPRAQSPPGDFQSIPATEPTSFHNP